MLYRSLCRFLKAAKAVASGRAVVGGQRSFYAMAVVTADYMPTTYVFSRLPKINRRILDLCGGHPREHCDYLRYLRRYLKLQNYCVSFR